MAITHRTHRPHGRPGHTTVVAPGTEIVGSLHSEGGVHIDGEVAGDVEAKTYVIVTEGGKVAGDIHAREVYLGGDVEGDIWAVEVEIFGAGRCEGHIEAIKITRSDE